MSTSLRKNLSKLTVRQLHKLSTEANKFHENNGSSKRNFTWQKLIQKELNKKQSLKIKKKLRKGIILSKKRK